jgi:hypothetical protein
MRESFRLFLRGEAGWITLSQESGEGEGPPDWAAEGLVGPI